MQRYMSRGHVSARVLRAASDFVGGHQAQKRVKILAAAGHGSDLLLSGQVGERARRGLLDLDLVSERGNIAQRVAG